MSLSRRHSKGSSRGVGTPDKRRQTIDPDELLALQNDLFNDSSVISNESFSNSRRSSNRLSGIKSSNIQFLRKTMNASKSSRQSLSTLGTFAAAELTEDSSFAADNNDRRNTIDVNDLQWLNEEIGKENMSQSLDESNAMTASPPQGNSNSSWDLSLSKTCATINSIIKDQNSIAFDQDLNALPAQFKEKESEGTIDARDLDFDLSNASNSQVALQECTTSCISGIDNWLEAALNTNSATTDASIENLTSGKKSRSSVKKSGMKIGSSQKGNDREARRETIDNVAWLNVALEDSTVSSNDNLNKSRRETLDAGWLDAALESSTVSAGGSLDKSRRETLDAAWLNAELESSKVSNASNLLASRVDDTTVHRNDRRETIDSFDRDWLMNEVAGCNESTVSCMSATNKSRVSSKSNRSKLSISSHSIPKSLTSNALILPQKSLSDGNNDNDDSDNVSVLTMNTIDVAQQVHDMLDDEDVAVRSQDNLSKNDTLSVSEMSFATVNTMELMGAVQDAIEEEELNRSMNTDDMSSVVPLQDLLRRPPFTPASNDSKRRSKRKSRSPAANYTSSSPALQKIRVQSPAVSVSAQAVPSAQGNSTVEKIGDSLFQSPSSSTLISAINTPVSMKDIGSVIHSALTRGEPVVLRSCLSARKVRNAPFSANKSVAFGSPNVAEFRKHSPTTSFTPLDRRQAKQLFSMQEEDELEASVPDEVTIENERILEEWDRLTNASESNSSDDEANEDGIVFASSDPVSDKENIHDHHTSLNMSRNRNRRRLSKLQPLLELEAEDQLSAVDESEMQKSSQYDASCTVQLPVTMSDLIAQNDVSIEASMYFHSANMSTFSQEASRTVDIEQDLHELMQNIDAAQSSTVLENHSNGPMDVSQEPSRTVEIENDLQQLLHNMDQGQLSRNSSGILSEEFHPLRPTHSFHNSSLIGRNVEIGMDVQETDYGRMPLRTSSILPASLRLSVGSAAGSIASRDSDLSEDVLQSIFGRRVNHESVPVNSNSAMDADEFHDNGRSRISDVSVSEIQISSQRGSLEQHNVSVASPVSKLELQEDLERLVASQDVSIMSSAASHVSILGTNESIVSSNASTVQDEEGNGLTGAFNQNISFIEAKKRIIFGSAFKNPSAVDISSISTQTNQLPSNSFIGSNVVVNQNNNALLHRLQALKEGAHRNTLSQCMTPGVRNKQKSREFQRLSLQHQQLQLLQQTTGMLNSSSQARRVSGMPSPIVQRAMDKSTVLLMDSSTGDNMDVDEEEEKEEEQMILDPPNIDMSCVAVQFDASMSLLKSFAANSSRFSLLNALGPTHAETSMSMYRDNEEIEANAYLLYQVAQNLNQFLSTVDDSLQSVILQAAQETFAMSIKGLVLGFEHLDTDLVFSAFNSEKNEQSAEEYVTMICDAVRGHPAPYNEERVAMALLGCSDWEKIWTNLLATAVFELSEALQQEQLERQQFCKKGHNDVFFTDRNRLLDKMLDKKYSRRLSGSVLELSASVGQVQGGTFSRFYCIEEYMQFISSSSDGGKDRVRSFVTESKSQQKQQQELGFRLDMWNKILNRMTFLQVREVFEDRLSVAAHLTDTVQLSLTFQLESDSATNLLLVNEVDSQLIVNGSTKISNFSPNSLDLSQMNISGAFVGVDESSDTRVCTAQENAIVLAYFGEFLVPDLKQRQEQLQRVSDLPAFLSVVAAHMPVLRKMLCFVRVLHMVGGLVMVCKQSYDSATFQLNMDHIDLSEPIAVDLRVLVAVLQMPSVFKLLSEESGQQGVVEVMNTLEVAQKYSQ